MRQRDSGEISGKNILRATKQKKKQQQQQQQQQQQNVDWLGQIETENIESIIRYGHK